MAFNLNNSDNPNNDPDLNLMKQYNKRAATLIANGEGLIPLHVLQNYFPTLFENGTPHTGYMTKGGLKQDETLLCQPYQPPEDLSFNENVDPMHTTNNADGADTDENWFNEQVQNTSSLSYAVDQSSESALGSESAQQLEYDPSDYALADFECSNSGFEDPQSFSALDWTSTSSATVTDPVYQYPDHNQSNAGETINQHSQFFGNNAWGDINPMLPPLNNGAALHDNTTSVMTCMTASVANNAQSLNTFYPTPSLFLSSLYPTNQGFPPDSFPTPSSTTDSSDSRSISPTLPFKDLDEVPGLYEQIGESVWRCTFEECGIVSYGTRDRTIHIETHAKWEEILIQSGFLEPENAIAIPRAVFMTYECKVPNCRYLLVTGKRYYVEDYRVDGHKKLHIDNHHPRTRKSGKEERGRNASRTVNVSVKVRLCQTVDRTDNDTV